MAATDKKLQPIIIKRIKKAAHGHHGGAWKIAYADFVTAMMAFFLLMWLLGSVSKGDLQGVSEYFSTPMDIAMTGGDRIVDSNYLIEGGGKDLRRTVGTQAQGDGSGRKSLREMRKAIAKADRERLSELRDKVEGVMMRTPELEKLKHQLKLELTPEGLSIQIMDEKNRPMFNSGSSVVQDYMRVLLRQIGALLKDVEYPVSLAGHTDGTPYSGGQRGYSNWELSAERANASRRELVAGGLDPAQVLRVAGLSDVVPIDQDNPRNPLNRRIAIVVLNTEAEERIRRGVGESAHDAEGVVQAVEGASHPSAHEAGTAGAPSAQTVPQPVPEAASDTGDESRAAPGSQSKATNGK